MIHRLNDRTNRLIDTQNGFCSFKTENKIFDTKCIQNAALITKWKNVRTKITNEQKKILKEHREILLKQKCKWKLKIYK